MTHLGIFLYLDLMWLYLFDELLVFFSFGLDDFLVKRSISLLEDDVGEGNTLDPRRDGIFAVFGDGTRMDVVLGVVLIILSELMLAAVLTTVSESVLDVLFNAASDSMLGVLFNAVSDSMLGILFNAASGSVLGLVSNALSELMLDVLLNAVSDSVRDMAPEDGACVGTAIVRR